MKYTKRLTVLIILALWCIVLLSYDERDHRLTYSISSQPVHAQKCSEDQYAANTIVVKKKAVAVASAPVGNECDGYSPCQNFEGVEYDNSETWAEAGGGGDEDYTTAPAPLRGSQSYSAPASNTVRTTFQFASAAPELWGHMLVVFEDGRPGADTLFFSFRDAADAEIGTLRIRTSGLARVYHGTAFGTASAGVEFEDGTTQEYHIWFYWKSETEDGAGDGILQFYRGTTTNRADATLLCQTVAGTAEADIAYVALRSSDSGSVVIFDQVIVKTSSFTTVSE